MTTLSLRFDMGGYTQRVSRSPIPTQCISRLLLTLLSLLWVVNTQPADANGHKFSHPGLDLGFAATHAFDLDTYRAAALHQATQHENSKEDKSEGKHQPAYT